MSLKIYVVGASEWRQYERQEGDNTSLKKAKDRSSIRPTKEIVSSSRWWQYEPQGGRNLRLEVV
jgi:hypothetical protein